jgi:hypothetical protein
MLASAGCLACLLAGCLDARPAGGEPDAGLAADAAGDPNEQITVLGAGDTVDTYLRFIQPAWNFGAAPYLCADTSDDDRRILMRFDLAAVARPTVTSASLRLWTGPNVYDAAPRLYTAYEVLETWDEGGQDAVAGTASWNESRTGTSWSAAGAGAGARGEAVIGSFIPAALDTEYTVLLDPAVIDRWVSDPTTNHGIEIVAADTDAACFDSSEHPIEVKRPTLTVAWTN